MKNKIILLAEYRILKRGFSSITPEMYYEEIKKFDYADIVLIVSANAKKWEEEINLLWEKNNFTEEKTIEIIKKVIEGNPEMVEKLKNEPAIFGFFTGKVMKESKGMAKPNIVTKLLKEKLDIK